MRVRIFQPSQAVDKGCGAKAAPWQIQPADEAPRVRESLMGWVSAPDGLSTLAPCLRFETAGAALAFARAQGWMCELGLAHPKRMRPRSFIDNFKITRPEDEERQASEAARTSHR